MAGIMDITATIEPPDIRSELLKLTPEEIAYFDKCFWDAVMPDLVLDPDGDDDENHPSAFNEADETIYEDDDAE